MFKAGLQLSSYWDTCLYSDNTGNVQMRDEASKSVGLDWDQSLQYELCAAWATMSERTVLDDTSYSAWNSK